MRQEGRAGKYMCRYIVHSMWEDVEQRSKIMGVSTCAFDSVASCILKHLAISVLCLAVHNSDSQLEHLADIWPF